MDYTEQLNKCEIIAIYLGNSCNFDCKYCDREFIKYDVGGQYIDKTQVDNIAHFFEKIFEDSELSINTITFHGGEPFLYIKRADEILDKIKPFLDKHNLRVRFTTNASLIHRNEWFIEKWKQYLGFTFSYDYLYQQENRSDANIDKACEICVKHGIEIHWQFVVPVTDRRAFSFDQIKSILEMANKSNSRTLNLIPLRHFRGKRKFTVFLDDLNLPQFFDAFLRFINTLYSHNITTYIDGNYGTIDKNYLGEHHKMILSPDGFIYPEYDFCEYRTKEYRIGQWTDSTNLFQPIINRNLIENAVILDECQTCDSRDLCGLKFLYKIFDEKPCKNCRNFYKIVDATVRYTTKLYQKKSFFHWIGYD